MPAESHPDLAKENSPQSPGALARRQARQNSLHMVRRRLVEYFRFVAGTRQDLLGKTSARSTRVRGTVVTEIAVPARHDGS